MKLFNVLAVIVGLGTMATASAALGAPGIAATNANVRSGPGTNHAIVDTLKKGEYVIVKDCSARWCSISHIGNNGYVSRSLLYNPYYGTLDYYEFPPKRPVPGR